MFRRQGKLNVQWLSCNNFNLCSELYNEVLPQKNVTRRDLSGMKDSIDQMFSQWISIMLGGTNFITVISLALDHEF